ncbi:hypothetical protein HAALTHF_00640n [Vreelandella aquamarina]|nr:hypothetical protein HAALTHF_00640n [Halomonas axialensis]
MPPGGRDFELVTPEAFDIYGLVIRLPALHAAAERQGITLDEQWMIVPRRHVNPATLRALLFLLERLLGQQQGAIAEKLHQDILLTGLLELLDAQQPRGELPPSYAHRKAVVDRVKQYVDAHVDAPSPWMRCVN